MVHCVARLGSSTALANSQAQPKHRNNYTAWDVQICVSRNIDTTKSSPWQERTGVSINGRKLKPGPGIPTFIPFCCTIQFAGCGQGFDGVFLTMLNFALFAESDSTRRKGIFFYERYQPLTPVQGASMHTEHST